MGSNPFKPYKFDPIGDLKMDIPKKNRKAAMDEVASYLHEELLNYYGDLNSPVSGGKWRGNLTKEYAQKKAEESGSTVANLELSGDLLDSLTVKSTASQITIDVGKKEYGKAEGHITGQYGGGKMKKDYRRQFLPQNEETFKRAILSNIRRILEAFEED